MDIFSLVGKISLDGIGKANDQLTGLQGKFQKVSRGMKIAGGAIVGASVGVGVGALKMAGDFDGAMREVNTMMLLNEEEFKLFSKDVQNLAKDLGVDAVESAKAVYQAISAGVPKENVLEFLEIAAKAGIGGLTDTETAVDGITTVLNAYKLPMSDAQKVTDAMFATVKQGKTTFPELAANMSKAMPIAAALGVGYEDVLATVASLTKQGTPTAEAFTKVKATMSALLKPTAEMKELMAASGYETGEAMLQTLGYQGALDALTTAAEGDTEVLGKAFGSAEALGAVFGVTGENAASAAADLDAVNNSAGAATDAFDQMELSAGRKMEKMQAQMKDMAITIGMALMPALSKILEIIMPIVTKIGDWITENPKMTAMILAGVAALGGLLLVAGPILSIITLMTTALPLLGVAFTAMMGPVGLIVLAIAAVIAIGVLVYKNWDTIKEKASAIWNGIASFFEGIAKKIQFHFRVIGIIGPYLIKKYWGKIIDIVGNIWNKIINVFREHWDKILMILFPAVGLPILIAKNWGAITDAVTGIWDRVKEVFSGIWDTAKNWGLDLVKGLWEGIVSLKSWIWDKVTGFAKGIFDSVKEGFGKLWPFSPSEAGVDIGEGLARGIEVGVKGSLKNIRSAMQGMTDEMSIGSGGIGLAGGIEHGLPSPSETTIITQHFEGPWYIREEADIKKVARELYRLQRSKGVLVGS